VTLRIERRDPATQPKGVEEGYAHTRTRWPAQPLQGRPHTVSELTGPDLRRLAQALPPTTADLAGPPGRRALGQLIHLRARIVDEDGAPVPGAIVEVWHCNSAGKYIHPNDTSPSPVDPHFNGNARLLAGDGGLVDLRTIKPAAYAVPDAGGWWRPPHVHVSVWGRVWLSRLVTQIFFEGEPLNAHDAILNAIRDPQARERCIARLAPTAQGPADALVYEYQLVVRGRNAAPSL
jgi:protocatechuate 3,4-dioxygenase beta subunit